jgi:hypothetical protein
MAMAFARECLARVQAEIEKEKAEALGRAGGRLEGAIRALRIIQDEIEALEAGRATPADPMGPAEAATRRRAEYAALRRQARLYHHYLIVQREALGFRKHGDVERLYPVPGPLARSEGDRREAT